MSPVDTAWWCLEHLKGVSVFLSMSLYLTQDDAAVSETNKCLGILPSVVTLMLKRQKHGFRLCSWELHSFLCTPVTIIAIVRNCRNPCYVIPESIRHQLGRSENGLCYAWVYIMACGFYSEGSLHDRVMPTFSALFFKKGKEGTN